MNIQRGLGMTALCGAILAALTGCGTTDAATPDQAAPAGAAITVTDGNGKSVTIDGPAERVVTLEWGATENVLHLGVEPVGIADIDGFSKWDTAVKVSGDPVDVGLRTEPNIEAIAQANPDLILGDVGSIPEDAIEQVEQIAPVVLLKDNDPNAPLDMMRNNFTTVANLLGKSDVAEAKLTELDAALADAREQIAKIENKKYVFAYFNVTGNNVDIRMHSDRAQAAALAQELGLENAWDGPDEGDWGTGSLDLEGFSNLPDDITILSWTSGGEGSAQSTLKDNPLWSQHPAVAAGRVHDVANGVWIYGGPASMAQWANELAAVMTSA